MSSSVFFIKVNKAKINGYRFSRSVSVIIAYVYVLFVKVTRNVKLLSGNPFQRRIYEFRTVKIAVDQSPLFAEHLVAVLSAYAEVAVLALRIDIISE